MDKLLDGKITAEVNGYGREGRMNQAETVQLLNRYHSLDRFVMTHSSILHTVQVPAFDPTTGQLSLSSHHLLSAPRSYSASFSPHTTLLFPRPPHRPYDSSQDSTQEAGESGRKKKRRKLAEESSPADWAINRSKQENKTTTDRESEEHHKSIVMMLERDWTSEGKLEE